MKLERIRSVFQKFDAEGTGTIKRYQLQEVLSSISNLPEHCVDALLDSMGCGPDEDEEVSFDDFLCFLAGDQDEESEGERHDSVIWPLGKEQESAEQPQEGERQLTLRAITGVAHHGADEIIEQDEPEAPPQPSMLRGKARHSRDDSLGLATLVVHALKECGWGSVDPACVVVEDRSGCGGSKTFKVTAEGAEPHAVALHSRDSARGDSLSEARQAAAAAAFCAQGVSPRRLALESDWLVEAWAGDAVGPVEYALKERPASIPSKKPPPRCSTPGCNFWTHSAEWSIHVTGGFYCCKCCPTSGVHARACQRRWYNPALPIKWDAGESGEASFASCEQVAQLLAAIHSVPTAWFDGVREELRARSPVLREAALGSHVWYYTSRPSLLDVLSEEGRRQWALEDAFAPSSAAGARVVSCHGEFHCRNILKREDGQLQAIGLDFACVSNAALDVAFALSMWLRQPEAKRRFARAYLEASGLPADPEATDAFLLDCEIARLGVYGPAWKLGLPRRKASGNAALYRACMDIATGVRQSPELQAQVLDAEGGFMGHLRRHPSFLATRGGCQTVG